MLDSFPYQIVHPNQNINTAIFIGRKEKNRNTSYYIADQLRLFYIIDRMENGDYNIGQESSIYGMYHFILKNTLGEA